MIILCKFLFIFIFFDICWPFHHLSIGRRPSLECMRMKCIVGALDGFRFHHHSILPPLCVCGVPFNICFPCPLSQNNAATRVSVSVTVAPNAYHACVWLGYMWCCSYGILGCTLRLCDRNPKMHMGCVLLFLLFLNRCVAVRTGF